MDSTDGTSHDAFVARAFLDGLRASGFPASLAIAASAGLEEACQAVGVPFRIQPHGGWFDSGYLHRIFAGWARDFCLSLRLRRIYRRLQPAMVVVRGVRGWAAVRAAGTAQIPCLWYLRELTPYYEVLPDTYYYQPADTDLVLRQMHRFGTYFVGSSRAVIKNRLGRRWVERTPVLYEPVDPRFFRERRPPEKARSELALPTDSPLVGVVFSPNRPAECVFFLRMARMIWQFRTAVHFCLMGESPVVLRQRLESRLARWRRTSQVHYLEPTVDRGAFFRACDVVALLEETSATGRSALEAMAVGAVVAARKIAANREVVHAGRTGMAQPAFRFRRMADRILRLLSQPETRMRIGRNAREWAIRHHSLYAFRRRLRRLLWEVFRQAQGLAQA